MICYGLLDERKKLDQYRQTYKRKTDEQYNVDKQFDITFERKYIKDLIHLITLEIKKKGTKTPLLILPFRPDQHDERLKQFLNSIFIDGMPLVDEEDLKSIIARTDDYILISALKFIWCRLPGKAVIGWKAYTTFVKFEDNAGFPTKAFLDFMPNCLSSGAHASIVYDFFDLIVALVLNSKDNLMTPKKLSKLCGLWAFNPVKNKDSSDVNTVPSFERGLYEWIPAGDAMFHLLLSFVKSMPPNGDVSRLPKLFQVLLKSTDYPPLPTSSTLENSRQLQEIPMVAIRSNSPSKNPAELLTRISKTLKFDDPTLFYTREDFLLLKRLFKEQDQVVDKLSSEGSRILQNICFYDEDLICDGISNSSKLKFKLIPGWSTDMTSRNFEKNVSAKDDYFTALIGRVSIDDYFIWTWLASLGIEETDLKKKTFGKTYIMEVELAEGFKKWVIVEEQDLARDGYDIEMEIKQEKLKQLEQKIRLAEMEAQKIKLEAQKQVEKLEMEKADAKKLEMSKKALPPPVPKKDYDSEDIIPPRSKSRKPPPTSTNNADFIQPPPRSDKRNSNGIYREETPTQREVYRMKPNGKLEKQVIQSENPMRISLPALDAEDTFLKFDSLGITEADLNSPKKMEFDNREVPETLPIDYSPKTNDRTSSPDNFVSANTSPIVEQEYSQYPEYQQYQQYQQDRTPQQNIYPQQQYNQNSYQNQQQQYNQNSYQNQQQQYNQNSYQNQQQQYIRSPPSSASPPHARLPIQQGLYYQQERSASPPRSRSPVRRSQSPIQQYSIPSSRSPIQVQNPYLQKQYPQQHRSPSPQRTSHSPRYSPASCISPQSDSISPQFSQIAISQQPPQSTPQQQQQQRQQPSVIGRKADLSYNSESIPVLSPPSDRDVTTKDVAVSHNTSASRSPVIDEIDQLETQLRDYIDDIGNVSGDSLENTRYSTRTPETTSSSAYPSLTAPRQQQKQQEQQQQQNSIAILPTQIYKNNDSLANQVKFRSPPPNQQNQMRHPHHQQPPFPANHMHPPHNPPLQQNRPPNQYSQSHTQPHRVPNSYPPAQLFQNPPRGNHYPSPKPQHPPTSRQYPQGPIHPQSSPGQFYPPISPGNPGNRSPRPQQPGVYPPYKAGPHTQAVYTNGEDPNLSYASNAIIQNMTPITRVDKLHGPQNINKKSARDAFMSKNFGI
ncbi:hypothetical protein C6P40_005171 [Pichia californica]|uniref:Meiotically up-regulated protein Msb1/Mug8 domain-containing protein n=1 Tax=Pichia californica TaxID=460514 RepID=A0A9P6WLH6_9ASCO|nr:hypothetical protein C6P40_005171 [[Candida] californica]